MKRLSHGQLSHRGTIKQGTTNRFLRRKSYLSCLFLNIVRMIRDTILSWYFWQIKVRCIHRCLSLSIYSLFDGLYRGCHSIIMKYQFQQFILCDLYCVNILSGTISIYSLPYLILENMNAWYNYLANLFMTLFFYLLKISKYLISDLPKHSTSSFNRTVSSRVKPEYWNDLTPLKVI